MVVAMPMSIPQLQPGKIPIYRGIVQSLADDIYSGRLAAGEQLPPHRELADQLEVARGTIAKAYAEAERLGLVRSGVGSGTYVLEADSGTRPYSTLLQPPVAFSDLSTNHPLPDIDPDPAGALQEMALRPDRKALLRYQSPVGLHRHRQTGVQWFKRLGLSVDLQDLVVCSGGQHALFVTLAHLLEPDDVVAVEEWSYPGLHGVVDTLHLKTVAVSMDRWGMNIESLRQVCQRRRVRALYCMPTAHNPTGIVLSDSRRKQIAQLARQYDFAIVEDAANQMFVRDPPPPLYSYAPERTYLIAPTTKVMCAGLRVGFLLAPEQQCDAVARHVWASQWMVSPLGAEVLTIWLEQGLVDQTLLAKRREARRRQKLAARILKGHTVSAHPENFHLWLRLPPDWETQQVITEARRWNIAVTPNTAFWMRQRTPPCAIRIALGGVARIGTLATGLETLDQILRGPVPVTSPQSS